MLFPVYYLLSKYELCECVNQTSYILKSKSYRRNAVLAWECNLPIHCLAYKPLSLHKNNFIAQVKGKWKFKKSHHSFCNVFSRHPFFRLCLLAVLCWH